VKQKIMVFTFYKIKRTLIQAIDERQRHIFRSVYMTAYQITSAYSKQISYHLDEKYVVKGLNAGRKGDNNGVL
jgi:hypothetical protein